MEETATIILRIQTYTSDIDIVPGEEDDLMKALAFWLYLYAPLGVLVIGITGNVLSFILLSQNQYKLSSTCFYMKLLAVFDSLFLISRVSSDRFKTLTDPSFEYRTFICALLNAFKRLSPAVSSILLATMSVDRLLAVAVPLKAMAWCHVGRAKVTTSFIVIILTLIHAPVGFIRSYITHEEDCGPFTNSYSSHIFANFRLISTFYIPLLVLLITNICIVSILKANQRKRQKLQCADTNQESRQEKEGYITLMLLAVTISSFLCLLPFQLARVYYRYIFVGSFSQESKVIYDFVNSVTGFFQYCNYGMNFYAYTLPIPKFRRELRIMLCRYQ